ncbi:MAG: hypothetical protein ACREEZ_13065 [Stellaceae bacterium]
MIGVPAGADAPFAVIRGRIGPEHVIGRHQMGKAHSFHRLRVVAQQRGIGADIGHRQ